MLEAPKRRGKMCGLRRCAGAQADREKMFLAVHDVRGRYKREARCRAPITSRFQYRRFVMLRYHKGIAFGALILTAAVSFAGPPKIKIDPIKALTALGDNSTAALGGTLRSVLLE